jgi:hypothetical protein
MYFSFVLGQVSYVLEQLWSNNGRILLGMFLENVDLQAREWDRGLSFTPILKK